MGSIIMMFSWPPVVQTAAAKKCKKKIYLT